jgi:hypothetical protein
MTEEQLNKIAEKIYTLEKKKIKLLDKLWNEDTIFAEEITEVLNNEFKMRGG